MTKRILKYTYIVLFLFVGGDVFAQADTNRIDFHKSSFIDVHFGGAYNSSNDLRRTVENATFNLANGTYRDMPEIKNFRPAYSAGLTAYYGTDRGVLFGIGLNYMNLGDYSDEKLKFTLNNFALTFNLGKVVYNFNNVLMHMYLGLGYTEYLLRVTNLDATYPRTDYKFDPKAPLAYNKSAYYHAMVPIIEVGYGVRKRFYNKFSAGITGGFYFSSSTQTYFATGAQPFVGKTLDSREAPGIAGVFLRGVIEIGRKGTKIYAGPRVFHIDTMSVKVQQRKLDSIENAANSAKKGTFENTYKKTLEEQYNEKGYNVRFSMGGTNAVAYNDTSALSRAAAVSLGSAAPVGTFMGQASVFIPLTPNVVKLPTTRRSGSAASTIDEEDAKKVKNPNADFDFNKVPVEPTKDTVKVVQEPKMPAKDTVVIAKDTSITKKAADSSRAVIAKALKAKKPMTHADSVKMKVKLERDRAIAAAKKKKDKRENIIKIVKQSQAELEEKYRKGLIKNDTTNKVIRLINESKQREEETTPSTDSTSTPDE